MSKNILFALAFASPLLMAGTAMSFPTGSGKTVRIDGEKTGTWTARNLVREGEDDNGNDACIYTIQWKNNTPPNLGRTRSCRIAETKAGNDFDCDANRRHYINSTVFSDGSCGGFDLFGQAVTGNFIAGSSSSGGLFGTFEVSGFGDVFQFTVR